MAERAPNRTKAMQAAGEYWLVLCANCRHPGRAHVIDQWKPRVTHCRHCTGCSVYAGGDYGRWGPDHAQAAALAAAQVTPHGIAELLPATWPTEDDHG